MLPAYTLTFVLGLVLGSYFSYFPLSIAVFLLAALGSLAFLEYRQLLAPRLGHALFACLVGGCLYWGLFAWLSPRVPIPEVSRGLPAKFDGVVSEAVRHSPGRLTAMIRVTTIDDPAFTVPFYLRLVWREPIHPLYKGTRIRARAHLHAPSGTHNPRGFDYAAYLEAQGVDAVASVSGAEGVEILAGGEGHRWMPSFIERWRERVRVAAESLPDPSRGLFLSLTIGEQGFLTPEVRDWFMTAGTVHILSISGSHLGLIALLSFTVIRKGCLLLPPLLLLDLSRWLIPTRLAALLTLLPVLFYALLAGAETATIRSFIMIAVGLWTVWLGASHYLLHALAAAAGITLLAHPTAVYDISFQLSYLSVWVLALALEGERQEQGLPDVALSKTAQVFNWLRESVRLTALVSLATMPLVACYFNQVSWLGMLANLAVVPLVGFILLPLSLISVIWVILTHGTTLPGAAIIDSMSQGLIAATHGIASLPGAEWFVAAPTLPMMALFYLLGWSLLTDRPRNSTLFVKSAMGMGLLTVLAWWLWSPRPFSEQGQVRVTFLDVGQGDSAVIELPEGKVLLIDGGATYERFDMGRSVVAPFLWNRGIRRIDHVIGTHPQLDHVGGLASILTHLSVGSFWSNGTGRNEEFWRKIQQALSQERVSVRVASEGEVIEAGSACHMAVLSPPSFGPSLTARKSESPNNLSVVTELVCGGQRLLFTGDIEREGLVRLTWSGLFEPVALLKVPHHGSRSSMEENWLSVIRPDIAVVSAGRRNAYGHPVREVLDTYRAAGTEVWRTDEDGAIWVDLDLRQSRLVVHRVKDWEFESAIQSSSPWTIEWENIRRVWHRWNWI